MVGQRSAASAHPRYEAGRRAFDRDALHPDLQAARAEREQLSRLERLASDLDGAERVGVRMAGPVELTLAYRTADGETLRLSIRVEESEPHRIRSLGIEAGEAPEAFPAFASWSELAARLEAMTAEGRFSGVVLAAETGEVRFHRAYGRASLDPDRPVGRDTRFNVGSLMKPLTGALILLLAGYDREIARAEGRVPVGWGGGAPGVNATLEIEPDGTVVAVVANRDPPAASRIGISVMRWLRER